MLGSLLRAASTLLRKRVREPEAAEPPRPAKRLAVEHAEVPGGAAWDCGYQASTHGRARATCRAPPRGTWALLPADLLLQLSSLLPLAVRHTHRALGLFVLRLLPHARPEGAPRRTAWRCGWRARSLPAPSLSAACGCPYLCPRGTCERCGRWPRARR
jgi:hypothetical protein